ncbi:MAG: DUF1275 domain-containing protein [Acetobacteraceae bacterium]|nr:DUF1275 domain-containing protein [Acetobacteraceae bacterium]
MASVGVLPVAAGMAFLAGATDVYGLARLHDLFVSFMSGNTTMLGVALGSGDWARAQKVAALVGLFVAGAAGGAILAVWAGVRHHAAVVALVSAAVLTVPLAQPTWTIESFVLAMGALNASMSRVGAASVSLTYVTGTLVKFGQGLGDMLCGRPGDWSWLVQAPMWLSLLAGGTCATLLHWRLGSDAVWPLPLMAALLALAAFGAGRLEAEEEQKSGQNTYSTRG